MLLHHAKTEGFSLIKTYQNDLEEIELELIRKYVSVAQSGRLIRAVLKGESAGKLDDLDRQAGNMRVEIIEELKAAYPDLGAKGKNKSGRRKIKGSQKTPSTQEISVGFFKEGKKPEEIANIRNLTRQTIMKYLSQGVGQDYIQLEELTGQ